MSRSRHLRPPSSRWRVVVQTPGAGGLPIHHTVMVRATSEASARLKALKHVGGGVGQDHYAVTECARI